MSFYFLFFVLLLPGIPAIVDGHYQDVAYTGATVVVCAIIHFCKIVPRKYVQFLAALVIAAFNFCMILMDTSSIDTSSKGLMFFRGYAFASIHVVLLFRFPELKQKFIFILFAYAFRFALIISLDIKSAQSYTIIRHFYIDMFAMYVSFVHDKRERALFKRFNDYREEFLKFKDLLVNYLPQSIIVLDTTVKKSLFSNQAYLKLFDQNDEALESDVQMKTSRMHSLLNDKDFGVQSGKPQLNQLQVDRNTLRKSIALTCLADPSGKLVSLREFLEEAMRENLFENNSLSISALYPFNNSHQSFELVLSKMKWDEEEAVVIILSDITDQERLLTLKIADENKDRVIATISHELRTPLNGIIGLLDIAEKKITEKGILEYLELCKDNAYLLLGLVNSLLDLQQINQGKLRLNPTRTQIRKVLKDVVKLFTFQCNYKGISLSLRVAQDVPMHIFTDESRLKQILINLIGNALKFTVKGGITVEASIDPANQTHIKISITDTGIGIKEEDQLKLFKMYGRLEGGRTINKNGVGLGLMISNTLAKILRGKSDNKGIEVKSKFGEGSQFTFQILKYLPDPSETHIREENEILSPPRNHALLNLDCFDEEEDIPRELPKTKNSGHSVHSLMKEYVFSSNDSNFSKFRRSVDNSEKSVDEFSPITPERKQTFIKASESFPLLTTDFNYNLHGKVQVSQSSQHISLPAKGFIFAVDDNPFNLLVLENIVQGLGYSFLMARSGQEALDLIRTNCKKEMKFNIILMDCQMPIMDGLETTKHLRELMKKNEIPVIPIVGLSANNSEQDIKRCFDCGMSDFLSKPLSPGALLSVLSKLSVKTSFS